ncbi:hypothetical protein HU200_063589 [Digitaria exilis]|uniref:Uncharacterized protein n=1 Tax=Digitaria exilis TaxID=1010633 RepID=A0A835DV82_9POAL|nr:hypothetical protein HU200_063589 [Digitaria exilis]
MVLFSKSGSVEHGVSSSGIMKDQHCCLA